MQACLGITSSGAWSSKDGDGKCLCLLQVSDPTRALKPTSFATDFKLAEHDVLGSVRKLAFPDLADLSAHLYKLNIRLPDDLLEAHLEMPRSGSTVGTLVVCFPTAHAGGQCVVQHQDSKVKYDWGLQFENSTGILQWAFFSSSAQHEILPVTSGAQVTLTYNLVAMPSELGPLQTVQLEAAPFGKALSRLLASAEFLPEGGSLGFSCKHVYPHTSAGFGNVLLKGIDAVVMATAKQLHLDVQMEPVWKPTEDDCLVKTSEGKSELKARVCDCEACSSAAGIVSGKYAVGGDLQLNISYDPLGKPHRRGKLAIQQLPESYNARPVREVQWVQKNFSFQLGLVGLGCKDSIFEPCSDDLDAMYSAAAIIVTIPPAEARMQLGPPVII